MRLVQQPKFLVVLAAVFCLVLPSTVLAQAKAGPPASAQKNPSVSPPAPHSKHHPTLLLAFGNNPNWSVRIGLKGPERFDRAGYPPIPLEPAEVTNEAAVDSWTYHAKDTQTGAAVAVHLTREPCTDASNDTLTTTPPLGGRYSFRAAVDHGQIGSLKGCARIATELFPKINNQPDQQDEDPKKKPPVPVSSVTKFQSPVAVAYVNTSQQLVFKRGSVNRIIPGKEGYDLSSSHDGKKLLFTRDEGPGPVRTINEYEYDSSSVKELLRGNVRNPAWSPDDSHFAFLKFVDSKWHLWSATASSPGSATPVFAAEVSSIHGWVDAHTILVDDLQQLSWVTDSGIVQQALPYKEVFGDSFSPSSANAVRIHPLNSDLLLVSAEWTKPPQGVPVDTHMGGGFGFFLYEIRSKRRVILSPLNMFSQSAAWSRDGFQIFFTGSDSSRRYATYRVFWDGIGLQKFLAGTGLVIGQ